MIDFGRSCSRHRPVLLDFVDHGAVRPETGSALAHLDRCRGCTELVEDAMLTITALRRLGDDAAAREPAPDAWPRLRRRIQSPPRRPAAPSPLLGVAMSFAIVAVLAVPLRVMTYTVGPDASPTPSSNGRASPAERRAETAYIAASRRATSIGAALSGGSVRVNLPAEILEVRWKEEHSDKSSARPPSPI